MTPEQQKVKDFHKAMNRSDLCSDKPLIPNVELCELRLKLIREEADELEQAIKDNNIIEVADALGDLLYVVYGASSSFGIDLEPIFNEIHRSNMTKQGAEARSDGKIMKGESYQEPVLVPIIKEQIND